MTDEAKLRELATRLRKMREHQGFGRANGEYAALKDAAYIAAANPVTILTLLDELSALREIQRGRVREAVKLEREECAALAEGFYGEAAAPLPFLKVPERNRRLAAADIAEAIRARAVLNTTDKLEPTQ